MTTLDARDWTRVGEPSAGSTPGGIYADTAGRRWYVKHPGEHRAREEATAGRLYALTGVPTCGPVLARTRDGVAVASPWIESRHPLPWADRRFRASLCAGYAVDAWLANRDVASPRNVLAVNGEAVRVDLGGALRYHAQGQPKDDFGATVTEWHGLRNLATNPNAALMFAPITAEALRAGAQLVSELDADLIRDAAQDDALARVLLARREWLAALPAAALRPTGQTPQRKATA